MRARERTIGIRDRATWEINDLMLNHRRTVTPTTRTELGVLSEGLDCTVTGPARQIQKQQTFELTPHLGCTLPFTMQQRQRAHDDPFERPAAELTRLHLMDAGLGSVRDIAQLARCVRLRDLNLHCNRIRHA